MGKKKRILIVEDNKTLLETLAYNLKSEGYKPLTTEDGRTAVEIARKAQPALIILDVMLPGMDGFEVCRLLRKEQNVPILMLTARGEEIDRIVGLEMGADDYLTKPFSMRELMARVKALLRRVDMIREDLEAETKDSAADSASRREEQPAALKFGNLTIDETRREVRLDGKPVRIKPKEYELLLFLARHKGVALSRSILLERVWGWTYDGNSRTVDVHVRWLREKIETDPGQAARITTVRGVGYRFDS